MLKAKKIKPTKAEVEANIEREHKDAVHISKYRNGQKKLYICAEFGRGFMIYNKYKHIQQFDLFMDDYKEYKVLSVVEHVQERGADRETSYKVFMQLKTDDALFYENI